MFRSTRLVIAVALLLGCGLLVTSCGTTRQVPATGTATLTRTSASELRITPVALGLVDLGAKVSSIDVYINDYPVRSVSAKSLGVADESAWYEAFTVPLAFGLPKASRIGLRLNGRGNSDEIFGWALQNAFVPSFEPSTPDPPVAVVFAHASPTGDAGTLIDARLSTGVAPLRYSFSPAACAGTSYGNGGSSSSAPSGPSDPTPTGTAWLTFSGSASAISCNVTVTDALGQYGSASVVASHVAGWQNGFFTFGNSQTVTITGSESGSLGSGSSSAPGGATTACVDLTGAGMYTTPVQLAGNPATGTVALTSLSAGLHKIGATFWSGGVNATCVRSSPVFADQTISDVYTVDAAGGISARRGVRASPFIAPSSLRFVSSKTISEGTFDVKSGVLAGATMSGSFSWSTPKSSKGVKRPVGAAQLANGTYVMRSINMLQGPSVGSASILLGSGTMLLRGSDGTLACGLLSGGLGTSTLTLAGGTNAARTLAGNVTGKEVTYVFPAVPTAAGARSGGVSGVLATALGWLTGDQPSQRVKKPAKKPKPVKVRPVKASGTASLQTTARAAGLPATCQALVQYLPQ